LLDVDNVVAPEWLAIVWPLVEAAGTFLTLAPISTYFHLFLFAPQAPVRIFQ
jgi:hypothetical protein